MRRPVVGVVGDAHIERGSKKWKLAVALSERLIDMNYRIVSGGQGDLSEALAYGARRSESYNDGDLIAILPGFDPSAAAEHSDIVIATGIDQARNLIIANSDAVIAIGGGAGTLSEIAFAWSLRRLVIGFRGVEGWSAKVAGKRIDQRRRYPSIPDDRIYPADTVEDATKLLAELLPKYNRRHTRIVVRSRRPLR